MTVDTMAGDEQLAREMQEREMQRAQQRNFGSAGAVPMAQMGVPPGSQGAGQAAPVVQGMVVGRVGGAGSVQPVGGGITGGAPLVIGAPTGGPGLDPLSVMVTELPLEEVVLLRYRYTLMLFTVLDAFSTVFFAFSTVVDFGGTDGEAESGTDESRVPEAGPRSLGIFGLVLLIGPLSGLVGAKKLQRPLVGVYLAFCGLKMAMQIWILYVSLKLWYVLVALVQIWVTKVVFMFWRALGMVSPERCAELLDPSEQGALQQAGANSRGGMYW